MKIASKIALSFFAVSLILTTIAGTVFYLTAKGSLQKSIYSKLEAVLASRTDHIETYLEMLRTSVGQLSNSITLNDFLKISGKESLERNDAFEAAMKRLVRTKEANPAISEFLLMDETGKVVASSSQSRVGTDKSSDTLFLCGQERVYIKDIYYSEIFQEPLMAVSAPLLDSVTGELLGVLAARGKLTDLNKIVANKTGMGETGEIYIVNKYGYMITSSVFLKGALLKQRVYTQNVRNARLHKDRAHVRPKDKVVGVYPDYRGFPVLGAHEYIPRMQWIVVSEIDAQEAFRPLAKIRLIFLLILFIVPIAGLLLGSIFAKFIAGPINRLRKGSEIIGSGNLDYKVGTDAKDEIGQLSRAFDTMMENLKNSVVSIENLNKEIVERKQVEEKLVHFQKALESATDAIGMSTPEGRHYYQNEAFTETFGLSVEETDGASGPPGTIYVDEKVGRKVFDAIMRGDSFIGEVKMLDKNRNERDILLRAYAIKDEKGKVIGLVGIHTDITERKRAQDEIVKARDYADNIIKSMSDTLIVINPDGKIRSINKTTTVLLGYKEEELIGKPFGTIVAEEEEEEEEGIPFIGTRLKELIKAGSISNYEVNFKTKDGNKIPVLLSGAVMRRIDCPGEGPIAGCPEFKKKGKHCEKLQGVIVVARDITERKQAEEEIKSSQKLLQRIIDLLPIRIFWKDKNLKYLGCNEIFAKDSGKNRPEDLIGKDDFQMGWKEQAKIYQADDQEVMKSRKEKLNFEEPQTTPKGDKIWLKTSKLPLIDSEGNEIGVLGTYEDITERKQGEEKLNVAYQELQQTQQELIQASKMAAMGQLAAGISHELNQPLTGIKGFTQAVLADMEKESPFRSDLNKIVEQADRIDAIIKNVRFFARKSDFNMVEVDINHVISESFVLLSQQLKVHNIRVIQELGLGIPKIQGDPNQLQQAFINIINNARDAILGLNWPEGGEIRIRTALSQDKKYVEINFQDTGGGIPEENLENMFTPFFTTKSPDKGMGLGLSITYRIIENHQGKIDFKTKVGEGTTFRIALPLRGGDITKVNRKIKK